MRTRDIFFINEIINNRFAGNYRKKLTKTVDIKIDILDNSRRVSRAWVFTGLGIIAKIKRTFCKHNWVITGSFGSNGELWGEYIYGCTKCGTTECR